MHISYCFLNKRTATIDAIKAYSSMKFILEKTADEIVAAAHATVGLGSPSIDGMPHAHNPQSAEDKIVNGIEEIDVLKERYRQAEQYMAWFEPAWSKLTESERIILTSFYSSEEDAQNAVSLMSDLFHIERTTVYNRKNIALKHLTRLLYGQA